MSRRKLPSFQFYPGDWLKDPALRAASSGARGLWIDMLCLMFEAQPRGYLQNPAGEPLTDEQIARMTGNCSLEDVRGWLRELETLGVFSRTKQGVIFSRRMVREEAKRQACAEAGKRGGNPRLCRNLRQTLNRDSKGDSKGQSKGHSKGPPKGHSNPEPTPSSSSSSSIGESSPSLESSLYGESKGLEELNGCYCAAPEAAVRPEAELALGSGPATEGPQKEGEEIAFVFPTREKGRTFSLSHEEVNRLKELFDAIDVERELRKALAWLEASPERRKTVRGMKRFLVNWLSRAIDSGHARSEPSPPRAGSELLFDRNLAIARAFLDAKREKGGAMGE